MDNAKAENNYDIIVIGSGMGGLTVASLMTQLRGKRVLVLERHDRPGGLTHDFQRGKYSFDTGLHYVGQMQEGSMIRLITDLIVGGKVTWVPMPDPFDTFVYPDLTTHFYFDSGRTIQELSRLFPKETRAIRRYFKHVVIAAIGHGMQTQVRNDWLPLRMLGELSFKLQNLFFGMTTKEYLDAHFKDHRLKALLASQWGDYGLPPGQCPFGQHSMIVRHFLKGGYYPRGGAGRIGASVQEIVENGQGRFLFRREVNQIIIENGSAVGVQVKRLSKNGGAEPEEYFAPTIVSNAGAAETYLDLLPHDLDIPFRGDIKNFYEQHPPTTNLTLFLGFSKDPRELKVNGEPLNGGNLWIYDRWDHDETYAKSSRWFEGGTPGQIYISFHSAKNPDAKSHSAEIVTMVDYEPFQKWQDQPWQERGEEYEKLKSQIAQAMITQIEKTMPGFADTISFQELGTPLTNEHFTAHHQGATYGIKSIAERFSKANLHWTHAQTPIKGLFLTGADVAGLGVAGAMLGGLACVSHLPGRLNMRHVSAAARKRK